MFGRKRAPKSPPRQPIRTGVYTMPVVGAGIWNKHEEHYPRIEVAEWEMLGGLSRVSVLDISGVPGTYRNQVRDLVGKWVPTRSVVWRDA